MLQLTILTILILQLDIIKLIFLYSSEFAYYFIKSRTLFVIFCFRSQRRVSLAKKNFSPIALKLFLGAFQQISRLFLFVCRFFFFFPLLFFFRLLPRVLSGTISSSPVQDTKNLKICPGR